jgi:hypothetical protein
MRVFASSPLIVYLILVLCKLSLQADESSSSAKATRTYQNAQGEVVSEQLDFMSYFLSQSACQFFALIYPCYASFKAIKSKETDDDKQWLMYVVCC